MAINMEEVRLDLPKANVYLLHDYVKDTSNTFNYLKTHLDWIPYDDGTGRLYCNMGMDYIFSDHSNASGRLLQARPFDPVILSIMNTLNNQFHVGMNSCHAHFYEDGNANMPFRHDMAYQIDFDQPVFILSLGVSRCWSFKDIETHEEYDFELRDGDLCILSTDTNEHYLHGVKKSSDATGARIGLSFRCFKSYAAIDWYAHE